MLFVSDTTNQPRQQPKILDNTKFIATSQIRNNLTVGASSDRSKDLSGRFLQRDLLHARSVSVQLLKELYAATGEIGFACHASVDIAATYPEAMAVVTGVSP